MTTGSIVAALLLAGLAVAHSAAGETGFITPIVNAQWQIAEVPRWAADRLLRTAWHLSSVAWLAMAAVALGAAPVVAVSAAAIVSGLMMLVGLAGHPAWPAFLVAGLAGFYSEGFLTETVLTAAGLVTVAVLGILAAAHVYWAMGGRRGMDVTVPTTTDGKPTINPGAAGAAVVAVLLTVFASLIVAQVTVDQQGPIRWLVLAGAGVLTLRAIGDNRYVGFTKKDRETAFGRADDAYFTPLCVLLALGAAGSVLA